LQLDEVIASSQGAHLPFGLGCLGQQRGNIREAAEHIGTIRLTRVMPVEALGDFTLHLTQDPVAARADLLGGDVRAPCADATPDVEAHRVRDDLPDRCEHAAYGHAVAHVCIGHERHMVEGKRQVREVACLCECGLVG